MEYSWKDQNYILYLHCFVDGRSRCVCTHIFIKVLLTFLLQFTCNIRIQIPPLHFDGVIRVFPVPTYNSLGPHEGP